MTSENHTQAHLRFDARGVSAGSVGGKGQQERMRVELSPHEDEIPWPTRLVHTAGLVAGASSGELHRWPITRTQRRRVQRKLQKAMALQQWQASLETRPAFSEAPAPPAAFAASGAIWPTSCSLSL
ncbi:unnamed protein product [Prorocentrum cordatum]|uniref:Nuclear transcription factor Y subunit n=1 Tax=Prorocentrum cordatum TaxID=2364126 RepID=A0ABN9YES3_9DINO|nr:unnamed protein product [Polarella glacialis]